MWDSLCSAQKIDVHQDLPDQHSQGWLNVGDFFRCCSEVSPTNLNLELEPKEQRHRDATGDKMQTTKLKNRQGSVHGIQQQQNLRGRANSGISGEFWQMEVPNVNETEFISATDGWDGHDVQRKLQGRSQQRTTSKATSQKTEPYCWHTQAEQLKQSLKTLRNEMSVDDATGKFMKKAPVAQGSHLEEFERRKSEVCTSQTQQALKDRVEKWVVNSNQIRRASSEHNGAGVMLVKTGSKQRLGETEQWVRIKASWGAPKKH